MLTARLMFLTSILITTMIGCASHSSQPAERLAITRDPAQAVRGKQIYDQLLAHWITARDALSKTEDDKTRWSHMKQSFYALDKKLSDADQLAMLAYVVQLPGAPDEPNFTFWLQSTLWDTLLKSGSEVEFVDTLAAFPTPCVDRMKAIEWELESRTGKAIQLLSEAYDRARTDDVRFAIHFAFVNAFPELPHRNAEVFDSDPEIRRVAYRTDIDHCLAWYAEHSAKLQLNMKYPRPPWTGEPGFSLGARDGEVKGLFVSKD